MSAAPKNNFQQSMVQLRAKYEAGDKSSLALAIYGCAVCRKPMPPWVADAWLGGWGDVVWRVADWNDLLGQVKIRTPKQIKRDQMKLEQIGKLAKLLPTVNAPIERDGEGAFRELGEKMGIPWRAVKELYYLSVDIDGEHIRILPPSVLRRRHSKKVSKN